MPLKLSKTNVAPYNYLSIPATKTYAASTAFVIPDTVEVGDYIYKCIAAGTTGASAPTWPETTDATVTDGTVTWRCESLADNPASVSVTVDNSGSPATISSASQTLYLVARDFNYTGITVGMINEEAGMNWQLSANNSTWVESLSPSDMNALSSDQVTTVYAKCVVNNNGTVATGVYSVPDIQTAATENPA